MTQIRAFLAVDLNEELKPKINDLINEFKKIDTKIKYVEMENLHLTLKFFGNISTDEIPLLENAIQKVINEFEPFKINIKTCGAFPNNNRINVIWVGIENDEILKKLHDDLDKEFINLGFNKDKKFSTHLTIGRMKTAKNKAQVKNTIEENNTIEIGEMKVNKISLKKSTLTPSGPIYEDIKTFKL